MILVPPPIVLPPLVFVAPPPIVLAMPLAGPPMRPDTIPPSVMAALFQPEAVPPIVLLPPPFVMAAAAPPPLVLAPPLWLEPYQTVGLYSVPLRVGYGPGAPIEIYRHRPYRGALSFAYHYGVRAPLGFARRGMRRAARFARHHF